MYSLDPSTLRRNLNVCKFREAFVPLFRFRERPCFPCHDEITQQREGEKDAVGAAPPPSRKGETGRGLTPENVLRANDRHDLKYVETRKSGQLRACRFFFFFVSRDFFVCSDSFNELNSSRFVHCQRRLRCLVTVECYIITGYYKLKTAERHTHV